MSESMTAKEAANVLAEASRYEDALRRRTEGLTWIIWGSTTPALFLTYAFAAAMNAPSHWQAVLWIPWVAAGVLATFMLWRSAALTAPTIRAEGARAWWRWVAFGVVVTTLFFVLRPTGPEVPLITIGAVWVGAGILNVWGSDLSGRILAVVAGFPLLATGIAFSLVDAREVVVSVTSVVVSGVAPTLVGVWRTARS